MQVIVAINHFVHDTQAEIEALKLAVDKLGSQAIVCKHWANGAEGAADLAKIVVNTLATKPSQFKFLYEDNISLISKLETIAVNIYGADGVKLSDVALKKLAILEKEYRHFPICIAKTQYSFSSDASLRGAPIGHVLQVNDLRLSRGAGFIVAICGKIMTMPGLPKTPASQHIDVNAEGNITGLS
jgi:formate--tetrahydrofolate ligase